MDRYIPYAERNKKCDTKHNFSLGSKLTVFSFTVRASGVVSLHMFHVVQ